MVAMRAEDMEEEDDDFESIEVDEEEDDDLGAGGGGVSFADREEPAPAAAPEEPEVDEPEISASFPAAREASLSRTDATPDVFFSSCGNILSSLSRGGFAHLASAVRSDTGVKAGRYLFEVQALERVPGAKHLLRLGFSAAGSSLFLGDGSTDGFGFDSEGTFFAAEPAQLESLERPEACRQLSPRHVVGVLLNLQQDGPAANTLSVFLDGVRAGPPQPVPPHLRGKALYPTISFRGMTLAVNLGRGGRQLRQLPFRCRMLGDAAAAHAERAKDAPLPVKPEVVVPVALPGEGLFDLVDRFMEEHPSHVELSDRKVLDWCRSSGLSAQRAPSAATHSRDRPDFAFGCPRLDDKSWRAKLRDLAQLAGRSCVVLEGRSCLLKAEREELLRSFPASTRKVALVAVGEPGGDFGQWVERKTRTAHEERQALAERRRNLREAAGLAPTTGEEEPPETPPERDGARFRPSAEPDVAEKALACCFTEFSLPTKAEGFDEVRFVWQSEEAAESHLRTWIKESKAMFIVEGLTPGAWFKDKLQVWHSARMRVRKSHVDFVERKRKAEQDGEPLEVGVPDLAAVTDIHDSDGLGTPLYADFKYEDWLILSWRYELHLLAHAFLADAADEDRQGVPEEHAAHYHSVYFGQTLEPKAKLGAAGLPEALKLLKEPRIQFLDQARGRRVLVSKVDREAPVEDFVADVEKYRRDRLRRVEAGDESASLSFPRPAPRPAKASGLPAKAAPTKGGGKGVKGGKVTVPVKAAPPGGKGKGAPGVATAQSPVRPVPAKAAPKGAKRPAEEPADQAEKRPRPDGPVAQGQAPARAPIAKVPAGKAPVGKAAVAKAPVAKAPVAKAPLQRPPA